MDLSIEVMRRGRGKTRMIVDHLLMNPQAVMLTHSAMEAARIRREFDPDDEKGFSRRVFSFDTAMYQLLGRGHSSHQILHIDNLDIILRQMFPGWRIGLVTTTEG